MDSWLRRNRQGLALAGSVALFGLALATSSNTALAMLIAVFGVAFALLALFGDRVTKLSAGGVSFEMVRERFTSRAKVAVSGDVRPQGNLGVVVHRSAHDEIHLQDEAQAVVVPTLGQPMQVNPPTIHQGSFSVDAVVAAAATAMEHAASPEELADRAVQFVRLADRYDRAAVIDYLADLDPDGRSAMINEAEARSHEKPS